MLFIDLLLCVFLFIGFYSLGNKCLEYLRLKSFFNKIIHVSLLSIILGLSIILLFIYPLILFSIITIDFLRILLIVYLLFGAYTLFNIYFTKNIKLLFLNIFKKKKNIQSLFFFLVLFFYFLLSIFPITDADSTAYHLSIPNYYINNETFPVQEFNYGFYLFGIGEAFNILALLLNLEILISLTNFIGLLAIISILLKLNTSNKDKYFYPFLILSCPILIPLINTAKPQFLFVSMLSISFSVIIYLIYKFKKKNFDNVYSIFVIICLFGITSFLAKVSFSLGYFFSILLFFIYISKNYNKKIIYNLFIISILINIFFICPYIFWKFQNYELTSINSILMPFPNLPGIEYYVQYLRSYFSEKNIITYFLPLSLSDLTNTFGVLIFIIPMLFFLKFENKKIFLAIVLTYIFLIIILSQRMPRFFLEVYILGVIILSYTNLKLDKLKIFKNIVFLQTAIVVLFIGFGVVTLLPGQFNSKIKNEVFSKYSNGYSLYKWTNKIFQSKEKFLTTHRSIYFSSANPLFLEFIYFYDNNNPDKNLITNFYLNKIDQIKPEYILFWDKEVVNKSFNIINFENCLDYKVSSNENAGIHASRNPFNAGKDYYPASIYKLKSNIKLNECIKINN